MFEKLSFFLCMCYVALSRYLLVRFLVVASLFCYCLFTTISLIVINTKKTLHSFRWAFQSHFQDCAKEFPSWDRHRVKERERGGSFFLWLDRFLFSHLTYIDVSIAFWFVLVGKRTTTQTQTEPKRIETSPSFAHTRSHAIAYIFGQISWLDQIKRKLKVKGK